MGQVSQEGAFYTVPEAAAGGGRGGRPLKSRPGDGSLHQVGRMGRREESQEIMTSIPSTVRKSSAMEQLQRLDNMLFVS